MIRQVRIMMLVLMLLNTGCHYRRVAKLDRDITPATECHQEEYGPDCTTTVNISRVPPPIPMVPDPRLMTGTTPLPLSLRNAILIGVERSRVARAQTGAQEVVANGTIYDQRIANAERLAEFGIFDTMIGGNLLFPNERNPPGTSFNGFAIRPTQLDRSDFDLFASQKLRRGGTFTLGHTVDYLFAPGGTAAINPQYQSALEASITQPLMKGLGEVVTLAPIAIKATEANQSVWEFKLKLLGMARSIEIAYWEYDAALQQIDLLDETIPVLEEIVTRLKARARAEQGTVGQIARAESNLYTLKDQRIEAKRIASEKEYLLRNLIGLPPTDGRHLELTDAPLLAPVVFDWDELVQTAVESRPEVMRQRLAVHVANLEWKLADNALLPQLDAYASIRSNGLNDDLGASWGMMFAGENISVNAGVIFDAPWQRTRERGNVQATRLKVAREQELLNQLGHQISHELANVVRDIEAILNEYDVVERRVESSDAWARAAQAAFDNPGTETDYARTFDRLLQAVQARLNAGARFVNVVKNYNLALVVLDERRGTLLEGHSFTIAGDPTEEANKHLGTEAPVDAGTLPDPQSPDATDAPDTDTAPAGDKKIERLPTPDRPKTLPPKPKTLPPQPPKTNVGAGAQGNGALEAPLPPPPVGDDERLPANAGEDTEFNANQTPDIRSLAPDEIKPVVIPPTQPERPTDRGDRSGAPATEATEPSIPPVVVAPLEDDSDRAGTGLTQPSAEATAPAPSSNSQTGKKSSSSSPVPTGDAVSEPQSKLLPAQSPIVPPANFGGDPEVAPVVIDPSFSSSDPFNPEASPSGIRRLPPPDVNDAPADIAPDASDIRPIVIEDPFVNKANSAPEVPLRESHAASRGVPHSQQARRPPGQNERPPAADRLVLPPPPAAMPSSPISESRTVAPTRQAETSPTAPARDVRETSSAAAVSDPNVSPVYIDRSIMAPPFEPPYPAPPSRQIPLPEVPQAPVVERMPSSSNSTAHSVPPVVVDRSVLLPADGTLKTNTPSSETSSPQAYASDSPTAASDPSLAPVIVDSSLALPNGSTPLFPALNQAHAQTQAQAHAPQSRAAVGETDLQSFVDPQTMPVVIAPLSTGVQPSAIESSSPGASEPSTSAAGAPAVIDRSFAPTDERARLRNPAPTGAPTSPVVIDNSAPLPPPLPSAETLPPAPQGQYWGAPASTPHVAPVPAELLGN